MRTVQAGPGDPISWGAILQQNDPREPEQDDPDPDAFADRLIDEGARIKALFRKGDQAAIDDALRELQQQIKELLE